MFPGAGGTAVWAGDGVNWKDLCKVPESDSHTNMKAGTYRSLEPQMLDGGEKINKSQHSILLFGSLAGLKRAFAANVLGEFSPGKEVSWKVHSLK